MDGISLSRDDKWLIALSVLLPPLAIYLKFGNSQSLYINSLLSICFIFPGTIHATQLIRRYPCVVFRGQQNNIEANLNRDGSVIWGLPQDNIQIISHSVNVAEAQSITLKSDPIRSKSLATISIASYTESAISSITNVPHSHILESTPSTPIPPPILNPNYGWDTINSTNLTPPKCIHTSS